MINIRQGNNFGGIQRKVILLQKKKEIVLLKSILKLKVQIFNLPSDQKNKKIYDSKLLSHLLRVRHPTWLAMCSIVLPVLHVQLSSCTLVLISWEWLDQQVLYDRCHSLRVFLISLFLIHRISQIDNDMILVWVSHQCLTSIGVFFFFFIFTPTNFHRALIQTSGPSQLTKTVQLVPFC